ncbi:hypothetical protein LTR22_026600, partial [Elasticomyces elasticus]
LYVARLGWSKTGGAASNRLPTVAATPSRDRPRDSDSEGCIVVRGGKVIGQGYNDYRPRYDGGALKHGRIANHTLDGPAMAEMKEKMKKQKEKRKQQQQPEKSFVPFEGTSGGH